jgi:hypothetical protein
MEGKAIKHCAVSNELPLDARCPAAKTPDYKMCAVAIARQDNSKLKRTREIFSLRFSRFELSPF